MPRTRHAVTTVAALALAAGGLLATGTPAKPRCRPDRGLHGPYVPVRDDGRHRVARVHLRALAVPDLDHDIRDLRHPGDVIERDGTDVVTDCACTATSGHWSSPYDGVTTTDPSTFDIDHLVPLSEAWDSGAWAWTTAQRQAFANDVTRPQLLAVSASSNRSKGDDDPAEWLPQSSYQCTYARAWVQVKHYYGLTRRQRREECPVRRSSTTADALRHDDAAEPDPAEPGAPARRPRPPRPAHQGTGVPSHERNPPVGPSSGSSASRTAPAAASAGSPPLAAARVLRSVVRSPGRARSP